MVVYARNTQHLGGRNGRTEASLVYIADSRLARAVSQKQSHKNKIKPAANTSINDRHIDYNRQTCVGEHIRV